MFGVEMPGVKAEFWYATMAEAREAAYNALRAGNPWVRITNAECETLALISQVVSVPAPARRPNVWRETVKR